MNVAASLLAIASAVVFGFPFWGLFLYGPFHVTLYRGLKRFRWFYAVVIALALLIGAAAILLGLAGTVSLLFTAGGSPTAKLVIALLGFLMGWLLTSSALARRRLQRALEDNQYAVEDSRHLRFAAKVGTSLSWLGVFFLVVILAWVAYLIWSMGDGPELGESGFVFLYGISTALLIWGLGGVLQSCADPHLGT